MLNIRLLLILVTSLLMSPFTQAWANNWKLVGEAKLNVMFLSIYKSSLYTTDGEYQTEQLPLRLDIEYSRHISSKKLVQQTKKEWTHLEINSEKQIPWLEQLSSIWPDVNKDDVISLHVDALGQSRFYFNDQLIGDVKDKEFSLAFLSIWLSENTSRPKLRRNLLGK